MSHKTTAARRSVFPYFSEAAPSLCGNITRHPLARQATAALWFCLIGGDDRISKLQHIC